MPNSNPNPLSRLASDTVTGLLSTVAQSIAGAKTFLATIVASAGIQVAALFNTNGTGASDVGVKVGSSQAAGSINGGYKPFSIRYGLNGGTEVEQVYFDAYGNLFLNVQNNGSGTQALYAYAGSGGKAVVHAQGGSAATDLYRGTLDFVGITYTVKSSGQVSQSGTDSSGSPGAATINKPSGVSAIAGGATTVTITNSLVTTTSRVMLTWYGDLGTQSKQPWVTRSSGSFTVNVGTAPAGAVSFGWEVSALL